MEYKVSAKEGNKWHQLDVKIEATTRKDAVKEAEIYADALNVPIRIVKKGNKNGIIIENV